MVMGGHCHVQTTSRRLWETVWAPGSAWTGAENSLLPGFDFRIVQPIASPEQQSHVISKFFLNMLQHGDLRSSYVLNSVDWCLDTDVSV
jgi:hypothetical protein